MKYIFNVCKSRCKILLLTKTMIILLNKDMFLYIKQAY